jgi:hypothetical protein
MEDSYLDIHLLEEVCYDYPLILSPYHLMKVLNTTCFQYAYSVKVVVYITWSLLLD